MTLPDHLLYKARPGNHATHRGLASLCAVPLLRIAVCKACKPGCCSPPASPVITLAICMSILSDSIDDCRKKYIIERKDGEKVVARKQGITTSTCLTARPLIGDQSSAAPSQTCKQVISCTATNMFSPFYSAAAASSGNRTVFTSTMWPFLHLQV